MNQGTKHPGVGFAALTIFVLAAALIGCPTIFKIPNVHFPPPYMASLVDRDLTCPTGTQQPAKSTPQICRISGSTGNDGDCNTYAAPAGAATGSGLCDTGNRFCAGFGTCTYGLATNSACYAGQLRYCDLDGQVCDPLSTGSKGCGSQPCGSGGFAWVVDECDALTTTSGLGGQPCSAGGLCYDGFACVGNTCVACGANGGPCCSNASCNAGLSCQTASATCAPPPPCGQNAGSACCAGNVCPGRACVNNSCQDIVCAANTTGCVGNVPRQCNSSGTAWINGPACTGDAICVNGACVTPLHGVSIAWDITTGGDDLRGGSNAVLLLLDFQGNTLEHSVLSTGGWKNGSEHKGSFAISPTTIRSNIGDIWLKMEQAGNDNWKVANVGLTLTDTAGAHCLASVSGNPLATLSNNGVAHINPGGGCP